MFLSIKCQSIMLGPEVHNRLASTATLPSDSEGGDVRWNLCLGGAIELLLHMDTGDLKAAAR